MRIRKKKWAESELQKCNFFVKNPKGNKGRWKEVFKKEQPIYIELGCGKGKFISEFAKRNKDCNIIAIDIKSDMLGLAKRNIEKTYEKEEINNVLLTAYDIERILDILEENDKIDKIYINFCNPWPKPKHKKRRLTHTRQLEKYKQFLKPNGRIYFKTDDDELFKESIKYFEQAGFRILEKTENLKDEKDIITEHQKMFQEQGVKIKFLIAESYN